jgi:hypothetical protein
MAVMQGNKNPFEGRQFTAEIILWAVRWYLQFPISYRDLACMLPIEACTWIIRPSLGGSRLTLPNWTSASVRIFA